MRMLLCTAVYEAGRPFVDAWCRTVQAAAARYSDAVSVLLAVDGMPGARHAYAALSRSMNVEFLEPGPLATPALVRGAMLSAAASRDVEALVFLDMDDEAEPDFLALHRRALADADASYGDVRVIGADGTELEGSFFAGCDVPDSVESIEPLRRRNFLGFTNTAVWKARISPAALAIPADVQAADWWFFSTLLRAGWRARRARGTVSGYRRHGASMIGGGMAATAADLARRCSVVAAHGARFEDDAVVREFGRRATKLGAEINRDASVAKRHLSQPARRFVWHEDVWHFTSEEAVH